MITSPVHVGLDAIVKLGATKDGILKAADIQLLFDGGAYSDKGLYQSMLRHQIKAECPPPLKFHPLWPLI